MPKIVLKMQEISSKSSWKEGAYLIREKNCRRDTRAGLAASSPFLVPLNSTRTGPLRSIGTCCGPNTTSSTLPKDLPYGAIVSKSGTFLLFFPVFDHPSEHFRVAEIRVWESFGRGGEFKNQVFGSPEGPQTRSAKVGNFRRALFALNFGETPCATPLKLPFWNSYFMPGCLFSGGKWVFLLFLLGKLVSANRTNFFPTTHTSR